MAGREAAAAELHEALQYQLEAADAQLSAAQAGWQEVTALCSIPEASPLST